MGRAKTRTRYRTEGRKMDGQTRGSAREFLGARYPRLAARTGGAKILRTGRRRAENETPPPTVPLFEVMLEVSAARPVAMPLGRFNHVMCSEARPSHNRYTVLLQARCRAYVRRA
ncbi:hypothetical protein PUN28_010936 [Cardiocondyla obscurior]|uniref:Uncharacterized protein n=1 Tax=Cardiocondyla obscurior TaxID=286306 RepID=A0AAW2FIG1_9HYME